MVTFETPSGQADVGDARPGRAPHGFALARFRPQPDGPGGAAGRASWNHACSSASPGPQQAPARARRSGELKSLPLRRSRVRSRPWPPTSRLLRPPAQLRRLLRPRHPDSPGSARRRVRVREPRHHDQGRRRPASSAGAPMTFATNTLEIAVPTDNPARDHVVLRPRGPAGQDRDLRPAGALRSGHAKDFPR